MAGQQFCGYCGKLIQGRLEGHQCSICKRRLCAFCAKRKGAFLGIMGGYEVCPYCLKSE